MYNFSYKNIKEIWSALNNAKTAEEVYDIVKDAYEHSNTNIGKWYCTDEFTEDTHNVIVICVLEYENGKEFPLSHTFKFEEEQEIICNDSADFNDYDKMSCLRFMSPDNDCWRKHRMKHLVKQHWIFFNGDVMPVMLVKRKNSPPLFTIGWEDDGVIGFHKYINNQFVTSASVDWIDSVIENLRNAKEYWLEHTEEFL